MKNFAAMLFLLVLMFANIVPAASSCLAGATPTDSDVSRIAWSSWCVGVRQKSLAIFVKSPSIDHKNEYVYTNRFRGNKYERLVGTYENRDSSMFQKVLALIDKADLSTIRLQEIVMLDGCADFVSVTACGTTTIVSDENVYDENAPGFIRLRELVGTLNVAAAQGSWNQVSDEKEFMPGFRRTDQL